MAIIIEKVKIKNTDIELSNVYARLSFNAMFDGERTSASLICYTSKAEYKLSKAPTFEHKQIMVEIKDNFSFSLGENETQDLALINTKVIDELTALGFKVTTDLI